MKLISERVLANLRKTAAATEKKYADSLLTKTVPVNARVAIELGLPVQEKVHKAMRESPPEAQVLAIVRLADYLQALEDYDKEDPPEEPPKVEDNKTQQGSNPYADTIKKGFGQRKESQNPWVRSNQPSSDDRSADAGSGQ